MSAVPPAPAPKPRARPARVPGARLAAVRVLLDVAAGRRADSSLDARARNLAGPDRALCQEIAYGVLRRKLLLDSRLDALLAKGLDSLPLTVRAILEVAAYQLLFLDRIPPHAAIHDAVEQVRELLPPSQARGLAGVVNGVLRALASSEGARRAKDEAVPSSSRSSAERPRPAAVDAARETPEQLALATSHPTWLVERWLERFGAARAVAILEADNQRPGMHLRPHTGRIGAGELVEVLRSEGAAASLHPLYAGAVVLERGDPTAIPAYAKGLFAVQDVSAQLVAGVIPDGARGLVVDLCAAPGGKVSALAERPAGRTFVAADVSRTRLRRVAANARRQDLPLHVVAADAREFALGRPADVVLADVPCLGTGTVRRRVDARWRISPERLPALVDLQSRILRNAAALLAPGGLLLYGTCSLEREENEAAVERLLDARRDLQLVDLAPVLPAQFLTPVADGTASALFVTPEAGDCDGAFAALLRRMP